MSNISNVITEKRVLIMKKGITAALNKRKLDRLMTQDNDKTKEASEESEKYAWCNHHHELTDRHEIVSIGGNEFVANKRAIPLLQALNNVGLKTRSHHIDDPKDNSFVCLLMDNIHSVEIQTLKDGTKQLVIQWEQIQ